MFLSCLFFVKRHSFIIKLYSNNRIVFSKFSLFEQQWCFYKLPLCYYTKGNWTLLRVSVGFQVVHAVACILLWFCDDTHKAMAVFLCSDCYFVVSLNASLK